MKDFSQIPQRPTGNSGFIFWVFLVASLFAVLGFVMDGAMLSVAAENIAADLGTTSELIVLALFN